jgi:hypothetical protein
VREHAAATPRLCPDMVEKLCDGSQIIETLAPAKAIICAPALIDDDDGEAEYMVDWRRLRKVYVLECFPAVKREPDEDWAAATGLGAKRRGSVIFHLQALISADLLTA